MAIQSSDVSAGDDILASHHNYLRADLLTNDVTIGGVKTFSSVPVFSAGITISNDSSIASTKKLGFDATGNTFIYSSAANTLKLYTNNALSLTINSSNHIIIEDGKYLYFDGGTSVYMYKSSVGVISLSPSTSLYVTSSIIMDGGGTQWQIGVNGSAEIQFTETVSARFRFSNTGVGYADDSWTTFSPDIKKHSIYKNKNKLDAKDYLDWALEDANKPIKPYKGIPRLKEKNEDIVKDDNEIFETKEEVEYELNKYSKDISKIAIGIAKWAEQAELRIQALEAK